MKRSFPRWAAARLADVRLTSIWRRCASWAATVDKEHKDGIHITAPNGLHGAKIHLPYPSVGATEQTLLAAVLAEGKTELSGAATEPEIMDLVCVLQKMGAIISVDVDRTFRIEGVKELQGYTHTSLTDRIEAGVLGVRRARHAR